MSTGTQAGTLKRVIEIRSDDGLTEPAPSYNVPVGCTVRLILQSPPGIGAATYAVVADGAVELSGQARVTEEGSRSVGSVRTDVELVAKSKGDGTAKVRGLGANGNEIGVWFYSFNVGDAEEQD